MKICNKCRRELEPTEFHRRRASPDGRSYTCKECDHERGRTRDYREYEQRREPREKRPDRVSVYNERAAVKQRHRPADDPSRIADRARVKRWREANPELRAEEVRRERARRSVGRDAEAVEYAIHLRADPCSYCNDDGDEVDHIEPVIDGGSNTWDNLTAACRRCNPSKGKKSLLFFLLDKLTAAESLKAA